MSNNSTTNNEHKLKTKVITGFDVYLKENHFLFDPYNPYKKTAPIPKHTHVTTIEDDQLFSRVIFAKPERKHHGIIYADDQNERNIDHDENINTRIAQHKQNSSILIDQKKIRDSINHEKSIIISKSLNDNFNASWELVEMIPDSLSVALNNNYNDDVNVLDDILNKINTNNEIENDTDKIKYVLSEPNSLLDCYYNCSSNVEEFIENKQHASDSMRHISPEKQIILEYALFQKIDIFRSLIQMLIVNTIHEKVIRKINIDITKIGGFDNGTFWMSIIHDNPSKYLQYANITDTNTNRKNGLLNNTIFDSPKTKPQNKSNKIAIHKNIMIDNISQIIELVDQKLVARDKSMSVQMTHLFRNDTVPRDKKQLDNYGIVNYLINHPFLMYCMVDGKLQMYKFFISSLTVDKIQYELYQIDEVVDIEPIRTVIRPKIISRDVTDKFVIMETNKSDKFNKTNKFIIDLEKLNMNVTTDEIIKCDISILQKVNNYATFWSSILGVIINDATKCIKSFISNQKKVKICLEPNFVDHDVCEKILNELQLESNINECVIDKAKTHSEMAYEQIYNKLSKTKLTFGKNIDKSYFVNHQYCSTRIYKDYHPIEYITKILHTKELKNKEHVSKDKFLPLFMNRFKNECELAEFIGSSSLLYETINERIISRDLLFMSDSNDINVFHNINGISNKLCESTIIDLRIKSNCSLKIYVRVENKCLLVAEGKNIHIPIIPSYVMNALHFKLSSDPDELIEELIKSNCPPYVIMNMISVKNPVDEPVNRKGFMVDFVSNYTEFNQITTTILYADNDTLLDNNIDKRVYFGVIRDINHLKSIENLIY